MKLKLLNEYGVPFSLQGVETLKVMFPYHSGKTLEKTKVDIVDASNGIIKIELSDFEVQGLNEGEKQNFWAYATKGDEAYKFEFKAGLSVKMVGDRKVIA